MTTHWVSTALIVGHWTVVVGLLARVVMRRPPVGVSVAWIAVIASAPLVGAGAYLFFGERRLGRRRTARVRANSPVLASWLEEVRDLAAPDQELSDLESADPETRARIDPAAEPLRRQAEELLGYPAVAGNRIELLEGFEAVFDALVGDIDRARERCHLCFYIWHEGGRTADVVAALVRAAERGVRCRLLADDVGSREFLTSESARRLRASGVELRAALRTGLLRSLFARGDLRNHRKLAVVDDAVAYTGSQNLVDPRYFHQDAGVGQWIDAIVRVEGPSAAVLDGVFAFDWAVESGRMFDLPRLDGTGARSAGGATLQVVPSGPDPRPEAIHRLLLSAIYAARRELVMTTPYFVPDEAVLTALLSAASSGVEVTLVVPAQNDSRLVRFAGVAHFDELAAAGVRIALFEGGLLHTKSLTIDGHTSVFGSVNLDMRSLWLNFELSLFVYDAAFTARLRALQERYLARSRSVDLTAWRSRSLPHRFLENTARLLSPLL